MYFSSGGGSLSVAANAGSKQGIALLGSDPSTSCSTGGSSYNYKGMALFVDHSAPGQSHSFGGGGSWNLTGTIYMTNTVSTILASSSQNQYQSLSLQGNSASGTVTGQIIVDALSMSGTPNIQMNLVANGTQQVPSIALVH
jgi:hypothetical protein